MKGAPRDPKLGLARRTALPPALAELVRAYPRRDWEGHANFSDLTRFWLERHVMFRDLQARLLKDVHAFLDGDLEDRIFARQSARLTGFFLNQLHGHHTIEDQHYFPQLAGLAPELEAGFELLDGDHHELEPLIHGLGEATNDVLRALAEGQGHDAAGRVAERLERFGLFLNRHLTDEEELVVPTILKYAPGDF